MLTALLVGEAVLLLAVFVLHARIRRLGAALDRLDSRFIDFRFAAEEEIERVKAASADFRRRVLSVSPQLPFSPGTAVAEALEMHPGAGAVLASFGIPAGGGGCGGGGAPAGTLEEAAEERGADLAALVAKLNALRRRGGGVSLPILG